MTRLNGSSSPAEILREYGDTASYSLTGDVALARRFVVACRLILMRVPQRTSKGDNEIELPDARLVREEKDQAEQFIAQSSTAAGSAFNPVDTSLTEFWT